MRDLSPPARERITGQARILFRPSNFARAEVY